MAQIGHGVQRLPNCDLTQRSSRPAFGGRLSLFVSPITRFMRAPTCSSAPPCSKGFQAFWASSACAASATSYPSCSAAPLSWPSAFSWAAPFFKAGRSLLAFGSNSAVKRTASPPLTLAVSLHCQLARFSIVGRTSRQSWRHPWMRFLENLFALTVDMRLATQGKFAQNAKIISKMQKKKATPNLSLWELVLQLAR